MHVIKLTAKGCFHFKEIKINYDDCWIYIGNAYWDKGYPIINRLNKNWIASRFVWFILTRRDYGNKEIHHTCRTRACVNPFHLEELTARKHKTWHRQNRLKH